MKGVGVARGLFGLFTVEVVEGVWSSAGDGHGREGDWSCCRICSGRGLHGLGRRRQGSFGGGGKGDGRWIIQVKEEDRKMVMLLLLQLLLVHGRGREGDVVAVLTAGAFQGRGREGHVAAVLTAA